MLQLSVRAQLLELVLRPLERARPLAAVPQEEEVVAVPVAEPGPPMPKAIRLAKSTRILPVSSFLVFPQVSTARAGVGPRRHETAAGFAFYHPLAAHRKIGSHRFFRAFPAYPTTFTP